MVAGLETNIAFKATDHSGLPIAVKGTVKDATGKAILTFNSVHDGMGKIYSLPLIKPMSCTREMEEG